MTMHPLRGSSRQTSADSKRRARAILEIVLVPAHLRRTAGTALVVGSWLTAFNQGDVIVAGGWSVALGIKLGLNYMTPFVVANIGLLSRTAA